MSDKKKTPSRTRNYATVVYLESVKENWLDILEEEKIPMFISPYHNKDKNPTGEIKKAHYHVMIMYDGPKTREQAKEIFEKINGVGVETINSVRSYARYLCHLDNPDKEQYDPNDVKCLAGADYFDIIQNINDKYIIISEMMEFIESYNILSFYQLSLYSKKNRFMPPSVL